MITTCSPRRWSPVHATAIRQAELRSTEHQLAEAARVIERGVTRASEIMLQSVMLHAGNINAAGVLAYGDQRIDEAFTKEETALRAAAQNIVLGQQQFLEHSRLVLDLMRQKRLGEFYQVYTPALGAQLIGEEIDAGMRSDKINGSEFATCPTCDDLLPRRNLYSMRCCRAEVCEGCLASHAFHTATGTSTRCMFCRQAYNVFRSLNTTAEQATKA